MNVVSKLKPSYIKAFINNRYNNYVLNEQFKAYKNKKKFILIGTPNHGNLGDQAITIAEVQILKDNYKDYEIIELSLDEYYEKINLLEKYINREDIIFIQGGGNFGNQYLFDENIRRDAINRFKNNKIILFPQTMYFTNDDNGLKELEISKSIYNSNKNLILIAREEISFKNMKEHFTNKVVLTPDIVLYLNESKEQQGREGCLYCLRSDVESKLNSEERGYITKILEEKYDSIKVTDTVVKNEVSKKDRNKVLDEKLSEFRSCELVVTDRIHGMIFAAITGTPCIAMSNYNHKVKGTYKWIEPLEYIKFAENINDIPKLIDELKKFKDIKYDNKFLMKYYNKIIEEI